jgi:Tfp pilus assembly protein PilN
MAKGAFQRMKLPKVPDLGTRVIAACHRRTDSVSWTMLKVRKDAREPATPETRIVPAPPPDADASPEVAAAALRPLLAGLRGEVTLTLPADQALLRIVELPTGDLTELPGMVELQVDRFSPFPVEHLVVAYEILESSGDRTRLLIAAVQRDLIDREAAVLSAAGLDVRRVDLDVLGWWHHLSAQETAAAPGLHLHLYLAAGALTVLALQDGHPVLIRALGRGLGIDTPQEIQDEIILTLTTLENEWGLGSDASIVAWFDGEPDETWTRNLGDSCGLPARAARMADLPPLTEGIARRALEDPDRTLNLAPPEWESNRRSRNASRRIIVAAAVCVGLWLLVVVGFLVALKLRDSSLARLRTHVEVLEKPAGEVRVLQSRTKALEDYGDRSRSALELLRQISTDLSEGLTLTSLSFRKGKNLNLRGDADAVNSVYDFFASMEKSGLYAEVKPEAVTQKTGGRSRAEFRVSGTLPGGDAP